MKLQIKDKFYKFIVVIYYIKRTVMPYIVLTQEETKALIDRVCTRQ